MALIFCFLSPFMPDFSIICPINLQGNVMLPRYNLVLVISGTTPEEAKLSKWIMSKFQLTVWSLYISFVLFQTCDFDADSFSCAYILTSLCFSCEHAAETQHQLKVYFCTSRTSASFKITSCTLQRRHPECIFFPPALRFLVSTNINIY